jgi:integrase/recombinase XerD
MAIFFTPLVERKAFMSEDTLHRKACIEDNPLRAVLARYVEYLGSRGYSAITRREYVSVAAHFGRWLGRRSLGPAAAQQFMHRHMPTCRCPAPVVRKAILVRLALEHLLAMCGAPTTPAAEFPRDFAGDLLRRYEARLVRVQGLAAGTVHQRLSHAQSMLSRLRIKHPAQLAKWTPQRIASWMSREVEGYQRSTAQNIAVSARSLLRFLLLEGMIHRDLSAAIPTFAHWRLAPLPETLQKKELVRLLRVPDVRTAVGLRDQAILLCLSEVGLRASDVAGLKLAGVHLASGTLTLYRNKPRKTTTLPMTRKLVRALEAYLRRGRPACKSPFVFVLHRPPVGRSLSPANVSDIAWRMGERANLPKPVRGAHVLRHTFASRLLCAGASLKQVADLLGHRSIDTTTIYAKVDFKILSRVALPWPGAKEARS